VIGITALVAGLAYVGYQLFLRTSTSTEHTATTLDHLLGDLKNQIIFCVTLFGMVGIWSIAENPQWLVGLVEECFPGLTFRLPGSEDLFGYYTAQLSLTFISISVMSVLSDGSVLIYWVNASEDRLIKPTFTSFAAYTYYSIGATVGSGLAVFAGHAPLFFSFFIADIIILILLTVSIIDVYFGKEKTKKKLRKNLVTDQYYYEKKCKGKPLTIYQQTCAKHYEEAMRGLRQNIYHAQAVSDLTLLSDIYELYFLSTTAFYSKPGTQVAQAIVSTLSDQTFPTFLANLGDFVRDIPRQKKGTPLLFRDDILTVDYYWCMDKALWAALARSGYFVQWIRKQDLTTEDGWELMELLFLIKRRLMQLHNDMVTRYAKEAGWDTDELLLDMDPEGKVTLEKTGEPITRRQMEKVFTAAFGELVVEAGFTTNLVRTLLQLLRCEGAAEGIEDHMKDFPIMRLFAAHAETLGLNSEDISLLRLHFPQL